MTRNSVTDSVATSRDYAGELLPAFKDPVALRLLGRVEAVVRATPLDS